MDWLHVLSAQPVALTSFCTWLRDQERLCAEFALDVDDKERLALKGKRDAFREIQAYIHNNVVRT